MDCLVCAINAWEMKDKTTKRRSGTTKAEDQAAGGSAPLEGRLKANQDGVHRDIASVVARAIPIRRKAAIVPETVAVLAVHDQPAEYLPVKVDTGIPVVRIGAGGVVP